MRLLLILIDMRDSSKNSLKTADIMQLFRIVLIIYLPYKTYHVENTSVMTDESVVSSTTSVFGNELNPTNTTPIPSFVHNDEQDKDEGPGLGGIFIDCQVINSEQLALIATNLSAPFAVMVFEISRIFFLWCMVFYAQLRCSGKNLAT